MAGPQPLSITEIMAFCAMAAITDPEYRMLVLRLMQAMDAEFMRYVSDERKKAEKSNRKR